MMPYQDMPDPDDQKKAEEILTQIGLHPVQQHLQAQLTAPTPAITAPAASPALVKPAGTPDATPPMSESLGMPTTPGATSPPKVTLPGPNHNSMPSLIRTPSPQENNSVNATTAAQQERARLINTGSGISQIKNPFLRGLARVGDIAGTALFPGVAAEVPGTELHHNILVAQANHRANQGLAEQKEEAGIADTQAQAPLREAQTREAEARAAEATAAAGKAGKPENIQQEYADAIIDALNNNRNPATDQRVQALKPYIPTTEKPEDAELQAESAWLARPENKGKDQADAKVWYSKLTPAARSEFHIVTPKEPNPYTDWKAQNPGGKVEDYLKATSGARATGAAGGKEAQNLDNIIQETNQAHELATEANNGNAEADVALTLTFFKVMKGQGGSNIRFTEPERKFILGARNTGQGLVAFGQKVLGEGQALTPDQRAKMVQVIDMYGHAAQTAYDRIQSGGTVEEHKAGTAPKEGGGTVKMKAPDGTVRPVPANQVDHYKKLGATVVQ